MCVYKWNGRELACDKTVVGARVRRCRRLVRFCDANGRKSFMNYFLIAKNGSTVNMWVGCRRRRCRRDSAAGTAGAKLTGALCTAAMFSSLRPPSPPSSAIGFSHCDIILIIRTAVRVRAYLPAWSLTGIRGGKTLGDVPPP